MTDRLTGRTPHGELVVPLVLAPLDFANLTREEGVLLAQGTGVEIVARLVKCDNGYVLEHQMRLPTEEDTTHAI